MEWATVLLSGVMAGAVSAFVPWVGGLHRDKKAAEQRATEAKADMTSRREDMRRQRLTDALVDFLAADRQRFDASLHLGYAVRDVVAPGDHESKDQAAVRTLVTAARTELGIPAQMMPRAAPRY